MLIKSTEEIVDDDKIKNWQGIFYSGGEMVRRQSNEFMKLTEKGWRKQPQ